MENVDVDPFFGSPGEKRRGKSAPDRPRAITAGNHHVPMFDKFASVASRTTDSHPFEGEGALAPHCYPRYPKHY